MRPLAIDYASPPRRPFFAWIILAAGALLLGLAVDRYTELYDEAMRLDSQVERLKRQTRSPQSAKVRTEQAVRERGQQRESELLAKGEGGAWTWPLQALEMALDKNIALVSLRQELTGRHIRLGLEARNIDDALAFAERLRSTGRFDDVVLNNHDTKKSTGVEVLSLTLLLTWKVTQ